jgi:ATP-dependent protease Clp ATPase subunit
LKELWLSSSPEYENICQEFTIFDDILFICGGAFVGLDQMIRHLQSEAMGFESKNQE